MGVHTEQSSMEWRDRPWVTGMPLRRLTHEQEKRLSMAKAREERGKKKEKNREQEEEERGRREEEHEGQAKKQNQMSDPYCSWRADLPKMAQESKTPQSILT